MGCRERRRRRDNFWGQEKDWVSCSTRKDDRTREVGNGKQTENRIDRCQDRFAGRHRRGKNESRPQIRPGCLLITHGTYSWSLLLDQSLVNLWLQDQASHLGYCGTRAFSVI